MSSKCLNCLNCEHPSIISVWRQRCFINNTHPLYASLWTSHCWNCDLYALYFTLRLQVYSSQSAPHKGTHMQGAILPAGCCMIALCVLQKVPMAEHVARSHHLSAQHFIRNVLQRPYVGGENWMQKVNVSQEFPPPKKTHWIRKRSPTKPWNVTVISVFAINRIYPAWIRRCQI